jgi:hypothetical protein
MTLTIHGLKEFKEMIVVRCKVSVLNAGVFKCKECGEEEYIFPKLLYLNLKVIEKIEEFRKKNLKKTDLYCIFKSDEWFVYGSFEEASEKERE